MAAVSQTIVREYFELHGFLVRQHRKYLAPAQTRDEDDVDFFVQNPRPVQPPGELPFVLATEDLPFVDKAVVVVKAWHTETFSLSLLTHTPKIVRFVESKGFQQAVKGFAAGGNLLKLLVVPALPQTAGARDQSIALLRSKGLDAVIPFHTILAALIRQTEPTRNYQQSDLLQLIRLLKNYDFFKEPQLELFKPRRKSPKAQES